MSTPILALDWSGAMGAFIIPLMILMVAIAFLIVIWMMASRYKKIPPNSVGIFYGRRYRGPDGQIRGFRIVAGGGSLLWPIVEQLQIMSTAAFQTTIEENDIPNKDNVKISVRGVATCKISTASEDLYNAAMAFLGKSSEDIETFVRNILVGHLRSIIGKLDINEILRQRDTFNKQVIEESTEELKRLGIQVITLVIQEVNDAYGYIDALGQKTVAEAKRDAKIKVAEAQRESDIKVAQAAAETKKRTSDAQREAEVVVANNAVAIAEAERDRDVKRAQFKVIADSETAKANQALAIATAVQEQTLLVKQAERDAAATEARIAIQEKEAERKRAELEATVVRPAEAARQKAVIEADASRQKSVIEAEAAKAVAVLNAEAAGQAAIRRAEGDKQAAVLQGEGEASKTRAVLVAQAEGEAAKKKQVLVAEAEGQAAMKGKVLLAEAEGTAKLAEALAKMTADAKLILILDRAPRLIELLGEAGERVAHATFSGVAAPMGNIDSIHIVDIGGSGKGLDQLAGIVPTTVLKTLAALKASGIDFEELARRAGIDIGAIAKMLGPTAASDRTTEPPRAKTRE
jgi:flotillin